MTNDGQNRTETRYVEFPEDWEKTETMLTTDKANHVWTNWAWANSRSGYDWMDSHFPFTDVS